MPPSPFSALHRGPAAGFGPGYTPLAREGENSPLPDAGIDFGIHRLGLQESVRETHFKETAWVLMTGAAELTFAGQRVTVRRHNFFEEAPTVLHLGPSTPVTIRVLEEGTEWAVVRTTNSRAFLPKLFLPSELKPEYRGAALVQGACLRNVRLIFDLAARPESNLVLGEVINYPGRWSSYPPHHHDQLEIYHYRFTDLRGYGHAELGDDVVKIRPHDTVLIPAGLDHAQVSAPGYGMYYLWIIRHLPDKPYTGFTFTEDHKWTLDPAQQGWKPPETPPKS